MSKEKPLKEIIDKLLRAYGYQNQLDEIEVIKVYENIAGKMFVNHTKNIYCKNKILYVYLDSAALKQELSYVKTAIVIKINQIMHRKILEDIIIK